jgi:hypothetical protein
LAADGGRKKQLLTANEFAKVGNQHVVNRNLQFTKDMCMKKLVALMLILVVGKSMCAAGTDVENSENISSSCIGDIGRYAFAPHMAAAAKGLLHPDRAVQGTFCADMHRCMLAVADMGIGDVQEKIHTLWDQTSPATVSDAIVSNLFEQVSSSVPNALILLAFREHIFFSVKGASSSILVTTHTGSCREYNATIGGGIQMGKIINDATLAAIVLLQGVTLSSADIELMVKEGLRRDKEDKRVLGIAQAIIEAMSGDSSQPSAAVFACDQWRTTYNAPSSVAEPVSAPSIPKPKKKCCLLQ